MICPNCRKKASVEHFRASPECSAAAGVIAGLYGLSKRKNVSRAGGRPPKLVSCPACGASGGTGAMRGHRCS